MVIKVKEKGQNEKEQKGNAQKGYPLTAVLAAVAAAGFLLTLTGCGTKSGGIDGGNQSTDDSDPSTDDSNQSTDDGSQARGEASLSDSPNMTGTLSGTYASETDLMEELFGSEGVYRQHLADNGKPVNADDKLDFLDMFGFGDSVPFYVHTEEDGYALMELYYDEEREIGCVILDGENTGNYSYGFAFNSCHEVSWHYPDPFSVRSIYGTTGQEAVTDYKENYEYDQEGRLVHYQSTGTPLESPLVEADNNEDWYDQYIIDVAFSYDAQGKLTKKIYNHSSAWYMPFGTWFSWQVSHYDGRERLVHTASYVTHGSVEGYYIYQGDSDVPAYFLELDHGWDVNFYRFTQY